MNEIETLLAEREIRKVIVDYCRGVDRGDVALIAQSYHPGSVDVHGRYEGDGPAFGEHAVKVLRERFRATTHTVPNSAFEFESDVRAHVETYVVAYHFADAPPDNAHVYVFGGRYVDLFEKRGGRWAITHRVVVRDWTVRHPLSEAALARELDEAKPFVPGRRDREDLGYPAAMRSWASSRA